MGLRVLLVDDHPDLRLSLRKLLEGWGYEVRTAADGEEALRLAAEFQADVVFLDLAMPGMSGLEVARLLRKGDKVPVLVALTGHAGAAYEEAARAAGVDHFFAKPTPPEQLRALLAQVEPASSQ